MFVNDDRDNCLKVMINLLKLLKIMFTMVQLFFYVI